MGFRNVTRYKEGKWKGDTRHKIKLLKRWVYLLVAITAR